MNVVTNLRIYAVSSEITDCKDEKINTGTPTTCASIFRDCVKQFDTILWGIFMVLREYQTSSKSTIFFKYILDQIMKINLKEEKIKDSRGFQNLCVIIEKCF